MPGQQGRSPVTGQLDGPRASLAVWLLARLASAGVEVVQARKWWPLAPPAIALAMLAGAPALYGLWQLLELPELVPAIAGAVAAVFAGVVTMDQRQGWPRVITGAGLAGIVGWSWVVWQFGPSQLLLAVLGWGLVAAWPVWLWHRFWRDRERFVQVDENRWEKRKGAPDPGFGRLAGTVRRWRKQLRRRSNRRAHRTAQTERELTRTARARTRARARAHVGPAGAPLSEVGERGA